ncbi:GNAT family N-acetyltransferase [Candidatus Woesearchaeota archaeon]|nr:GNAT family N-acetyltransferase [Candidatus Woesearchaeota archaeon]
MAHEELSDLVRKLGINEPFSIGRNSHDREVAIAPYDEAHADSFTHWYSEDNKAHLGHFVTKGWSPSIKGMKAEHGDSYRESEEYQAAREQRHQNTLKRNAKDRYFFTILEEGEPIGYVSAVEKVEDGHKLGRISVMIGLSDNCKNGNGSIALTKMLQVLAERADLELYDGKAAADNEESLRLMRRVFGADTEVTKDFENTYKALDGKTETRTVQRQYFARPRDFFLK